MRPWHFDQELIAELCKSIGVPLDQRTMAYIVAEDDRYPLLCINGSQTFGIWLDPDTRKPRSMRRQCLCSAGYDDQCICDL